MSVSASKLRDDDASKRHLETQDRKATELSGGGSYRIMSTYTSEKTAELIINTCLLNPQTAKCKAPSYHPESGQRGFAAG